LEELSDLEVAHHRAMKTELKSCQGSAAGQQACQPLPNFDITKLRETLELAEKKAAAASALVTATASLAVTGLTAPGQKSKVTPRRKHSEAAAGYVPPKQLLQYLVRMGSFTSAPAVASGDVQDNNLSFQETTHEQLLQRCEEELKSQPAAFQRRFRKYSFQHTLDKPSTDKIDSDDSCIRIFQWNHLSQTLGTKNDQFVKCPPEALVWETRRWRLLEEILRHQPDVICLQEVDHFKLLEKALGSVGYSGRFLPKPDSPCIYLTDNNGPDGCAIFVRDSKFEVLSEARRILEVWRVQSNQVVLCMNLKEKESGKELCVATTHLKARKGALLSTLRNEQGKDMLDWLALKAAGRALVLCGDFNADPSEPVYTSVTNHAALQLSSAYPTSSSSQEELYTTWKIRETGEQKYILDYIFHSKQLEPAAILEMPRDNEIGEDRLPSLQFPSDHLSLVADFKLN